MYLAAGESVKGLNLRIKTSEGSTCSLLRCRNNQVFLLLGSLPNCKEPHSLQSGYQYLSES